MAQVINAHDCDSLFLKDVGSNLEIFALFFFSLSLSLFLALSFIIFLLTRKT